MLKMAPAFCKVPGAVAPVVFLLLAAATLPAQTVTVSIEWNQRQNISAMTPTLQVVSDSLLERTAVPHDSAYAELARINASYTGLSRGIKWGSGYRSSKRRRPPKPSGTLLGFFNHRSAGHRLHDRAGGAMGHDEFFDGTLLDTGRYRHRPGLRLSAARELLCATARAGSKRWFYR